MAIKLHEIEIGSQDPETSKSFYSDLGLECIHDQKNLKVFNAGVDDLDFNISNHLPKNKIMISFLTDDIEHYMQLLRAKNISYSGPKSSHLNMITIEFNDPGGNLIRINQNSVS